MIIYEPEINNRRSKHKETLTYLSLILVVDNKRY